MLFNTDVFRCLEIYILLAKFVIFYNDSHFAKAMVGENVRNAVHDEFRYVISIVTIYNDNNHRPIENTHRCTATLISKQDALTADHCLANMQLVGFKFLIGSHDLREAQSYYCQWWWSYNIWAQQRNIQTPFRQNDLAFLKILGDVPDGVPFATISSTENSRLIGQPVVTATWGFTNNGSTSRYLQTANLRIIPNVECGQKITQLVGSRFTVHERRLCTIANPFVLLQRGDSGGPLLIGNVIVAINHGTCPQLRQPFHPDQVNLHTGIHFYRHFILDVTRNTQTHYVIPGG